MIASLPHHFSTTCSFRTSPAWVKWHKALEFQVTTKKGTGENEKGWSNRLKAPLDLRGGTDSAVKLLHDRRLVNTGIGDGRVVPQDLATLRFGLNASQRNSVKGDRRIFLDEE